MMDKVVGADYSAKRLCCNCHDFVNVDEAIDVSHGFNLSEDLAHTCSVKCTKELNQALEDGTWKEPKKWVV